jgi:DNA-binding transcriptional regulator LsrR (DeoR family)
MSKPRSRSLLAEVARLYYLENLSQDTIAARLAMTRSNVSRVLRAARELGVVEVKIADTARRLDLEAALTERFDIQGARIVDATVHESPLQEVANIAATTFLDEIRSKQIAAISWGSTLQAVVDSVQPGQAHYIDVVQLVGGIVSLTTSGTAQELVRELAKRLGARYHYLNAPAVFDSAASVAPLLNETSIRETLGLARRAEVALVGIGNPASGPSAVVLRLLQLSPSEFEEFRAAKPVGDICGRFFDVAGNEIFLPPVHDRVLAVDLLDLQAIPAVIGVATGTAKAVACLGALHTRTINILVCDSALAERILELKTSYDAGELTRAAVDVFGKHLGLGHPRALP